MNATFDMGQKSHFLLPQFRQVVRSIWRKYTSKRLSEAADVPLDTAKNWVRGRGEPRADDLLRMALNDPEACAKFLEILAQLDQQRSAIRAGLARLEATRPAVARAAVDRAQRMGARPRRGLPAPAAGVVK